jgi:hypothetical protein
LEKGNLFRSWRRAIGRAKEILMKRLLASIVQFGARARIGGYLPGTLLIPTLAMLGMTVAQGHSSSFEADDSDEWRQQVQEVLRDTEKSLAQFRAMRQEAQRLREQERARIPDYTAALAKATSAFQKHLMDLHPRYTNCQIRRKHVKEIRTLIKRIGQILD